MIYHEYQEYLLSRISSRRSMSSLTRQPYKRNNKTKGFVHARFRQKRLHMKPTNILSIRPNEPFKLICCSPVCSALASISPLIPALIQLRVDRPSLFNTPMPQTLDIIPESLLSRWQTAPPGPPGTAKPSSHPLSRPPF